MARIYRDAYGVPHVRAGSVADLAHGQGEVTARDRAWQLEWLRRRATGTTEEIFGEPAVEWDRFARATLVAETAQRVVVQYAGQQAETQEALGLFADPMHPYTQALLNALPERATARLLPTIPGIVPGAADRPTGCLFHPRCPYATERCVRDEPPLAPGPRGRVRFLYPLTGGIPANHPGHASASPCPV